MASLIDLEVFAVLNLHLGSFSSRIPSRSHHHHPHYNQHHRNLYSHHHHNIFIKVVFSTGVTLISITMIAQSCPWLTVLGCLSLEEKILSVTENEETIIKN